MRSRGRQSGLALVIVIWVISLLTIMAGSFALTMRRETSVTASLRDTALIQAYAESGVSLAQKMLSIRDKSQRWQANGSIYAVTIDGYPVRIKLLSERGKVDINRADEALLQKLFASVVDEIDRQQALVSAILDWRDSDDLVHVNGAEKEQYLQAGLNYTPANRDFQQIEELQNVLGMTAEIYQQIQPMITLYSGQKTVDLQLADKMVLMALTDLTEAQIDEYLQQRKQNMVLSLPTPRLPGIMQSTTQSADSDEVYSVISQVQLAPGIEGGVRVVMKKNTVNDSEQLFQTLDWQPVYEEKSLFGDEMENVLINESE